MPIEFQPSIVQDQVIFKVADETVNGSATLQNDDELLVPVTANQKWIFTLFLLFDSGTTPDIKVKWSAPSGATMQWGVGDGSPQAVQSVTSEVAPAGAGAGTAQMLVFSGEITIGSNGGNVQLQWAQNTSDASDTKVLAGSWIHAVKVS